MHPKRDIAIAMRFEGASVKEIARKLSVARSTVSHIVRDVPLTGEQEVALQARQRANWDVFARRPMDVERCRAGGKRTWRLHRKTCLANLACGRELANLAYRKDEMPIKALLQRMYGKVFNKEAINGRIVDFACADLIIEYTVDGTHGTFDLIRRFEDIATDPRRKIAYVDVLLLGPRNRARLSAVVDEIHDYRALA